MAHNLYSIPIVSSPWLARMAPDEGRLPDTRPVKRPRIMVAADGFSKPPSKPKTPALKQKPPTFTSAFTTSIDHPTPSKATALHTPLRTLKPLTRAFATTQLVNDDAPRQLRPAPPPVLHIPNDTPTVTLKHRPPPLLNLQASTSNILLKSLPPPMPIETTPILKPPSKVLKPLIPPNPPELQHTSAEVTNKEMRTISTTHIARATDLSTDRGVTELASIFLHDQHPDILLPNEPGASIHHMRGLDISPEKKGKGKLKFIRYFCSTCYFARQLTFPLAMD